MDVERRRLDDLERQVETLGIALEHRTTIGKALGIIMERLDLDDQSAFDYLRRCSQVQNQKLYDLAHQIVESREMPDAQGTQGA